MPPHTTDARLYKLDSKAMTQLAHGTCVVIASLLAIPDGIALIPRATDLVSWILSVIGVWLSAAVLWFVGFLGILHVVSFLVKGVEIDQGGIRLWRLARRIPWDNVDAVAIEPQQFFSKVFSLKPVARRLTVFELKKSWRKGAEPHLVPHHLPSFLFALEEFDRLFADICQTKFGYAPTFPEVIVAKQPSLARLKSVYSMLGWQRIALSILIAMGLVMLLGRKAVVNYQYNSGNKAMRANHFAEAKGMYENATAIEPTFAAGWNNLANTEFLMGDFGDAETHWNRALFYKPDFVEAKVSLAYLALQKRDFSRASDLTDSALNLAPMNLAALVTRADCSMRLGHVRDAIADARQVLSFDPGAAVHRFDLHNPAATVKPKRTDTSQYMAACLLAQGKLHLGEPVEAAKILENWAPVPNPRARNGLNITFRLLVTSQVDRALHKLEDARKAIDLAVERAPRSAEILIEQANVQIEMNELPTAATTLDTAQRLAPSNPWVYVTKAELLHRQMPDRTVSVAELLGRAAKCPNPDADSLAQAAQLYWQIGYPAEAKMLAKASLAMEPVNPVALSIASKAIAK